MYKLKSKDDEVGHYQSLANRLSESFHNGFDSIKNSRVGKFVYNEDIDRFSLYNLNIEGEAIRETGETLKNVAKGVYQSVKEAPDVLRDSEKRSAFWKAYKTKIGCLALGLGVATAVELGLGRINLNNLNNQASTYDVGWWWPGDFGHTSTWTRVINGRLVFYYPYPDPVQNGNTLSAPIVFGSLNPHSPSYVIAKGTPKSLDGIWNRNWIDGNGNYVTGGVTMPSEVSQIVNSAANITARKFTAAQQSVVPAVASGVASGATPYTAFYAHNKLKRPSSKSYQTLLDEWM